MKNILSILFSSLVLIACGTKASVESANVIQQDSIKDVSTLLLKDYRPRSLYKNNETFIEKAKYPVIDLHAHPYAKSEAELEQWVKTMDQMGVDKTVVMTYETGAAFDSLFQVYSKYEDRFILFCGFD